MKFFILGLQTVNKMTHKFLYGMLFCVFLLVSTNVLAVNLSAYRIYLDQENTDKTFVIFNRDPAPKTCHLSLIHNSVGDKGQLTEYVGDELPKNAANPWIRFSPKRFVVTPANAQNVRFTLRRKANVTAAEYRAFLRVDCRQELSLAKPKSSPDEQTVKVAPSLRHNIPIIVRTGELSVDAKFNNFKIVGETLSFDLVRTGQRSLYGNIEVVDKNTGKPIFGTKSVSIYPEATSYSFSFNTNGLPAEQLSVQFVEDYRYGGDKTFRQDVEIN